MRAFVLVLAAGCGRVGFDPTAMADAADGSPGAHSTLFLNRFAPGETLVNFPLPIVLDATRADLSVLTSDSLRAFSGATELPLEIETVGPPLVAWVRVPLIETTISSFTIEYGGAPRTPASVWDDSYLGVWHMSVAGLDSSPYARASTVTAVVDAAGQVGGAGAYSPAATSCIAVPSFTSLSTTMVTIAAWIRMAVAPGGGTNYFTGITRQTGNTSQDDFLLGLDPNARPIGAAATDTAASPTRTGPSGLSVGPWHHLAFTYMNGFSALYVDGAIISSGAASGMPITGPRPAFIGCGRNFGVVPIDQPDSSYLDGDLDEVRFESVARSPAWMGYAYQAQLDTVITYGPIERIDP